ncbi:DUF3987 domain-containing protein [Desulfosediminicola ganghwensis]|uniref:DUF3987 domain-containing protein n=1 Tax=Desulfosediminicola ganghwensis TaxID=2569540 RepID=UPI0010AC3EB4|nr:DUF3987 domain-containing protein [Desulfosediminicola ganghwensis]
MISAEQIGLALDGRLMPGGEWRCICPAHDDHNPSLDIKDGDTGKPIVICRAGCSSEAVISALARQGLWYSKADQTPFSQEEHQENRLKREAENKRKWELAKKTGRRLGERSILARQDHPYLSRKGVKAVPYLCELSIEEVEATIGYIPKQGKEPLQGRILLAPFFDSTYHFWTLEMIDPDGRKAALAGGRKQGHFFTPEDLPESPKRIFIAEGIATCLSIKEATCMPTISVGSCTNFLPVAKALKEQYESVEIVICGDLGNGAKSATDAATLVGGKVIFPPNHLGEGADFNDLHVKNGLSAVREQLSLALNDNQNEWPDPEEIKAELQPVAPLTSEMIPAPFREWVEDIAYRMQAPVDYVAVALIVVCGSLIGTRCRIKPKQKDDWAVTPNLWGAVIGPPSAMKSPTLNEILKKTLSKLEIIAAEEHKQAKLESLAKMYVKEEQVREIKSQIRQAVKKKDEAKAEEIANQMQPEQSLEPPQERRYKTNDATIEKLNDLLSRNPSGLLVFRDELMGLFKRLDKAGNETDRAFYLESFNGDGSFIDDRIGRGTIRTEKLCLSLLGGVQPDKIKSYLHAAIHGGENDGFVQRLQLSVFPDQGEWKYTDQYPSSQAKNRAYELIEALDNYPFEDRQYLRFSEDAQIVFIEWLTDLQTNKLLDDTTHPILVEHLTKYRSLMPSLALIFHLLDMIDSGRTLQPVSEHAAIMAACWCDYLETHARRIYSLALDPAQTSLGALAKKLQQGKLKNGFTIRDIQRKGWTMLSDPILVKEALEMLVSAGWLRPVDIPQYGAGRPKSLAYHINPKIWDSV